MLLRATRIVAAVFILSSLSGCVALALGGAAGAGGVIYAKGQIKDNINAPLERAYKACEATLNSKKLAILSKSQDSSSARLKSKYADGKEIWIDLEAITSEVCEIRIRVGALGDQGRSIDLLDGIKSRL